MTFLKNVVSFIISKLLKIRGASVTNIKNTKKASQLKKKKHYSKPKILNLGKLTKKTGGPSGSSAEIAGYKPAFG